MDKINWQNLTKKERRRLKQEQKRIRRQQEARKNRLFKWGFILGGIVLLVGGVFLFKYFNQKRFENPPKIEVTPKTSDFGKVSQALGKVETNFKVKNTGVSPLIISGMETSCDCTFAKLRFGEKESPLFGMHSNPTGWSASVEPGGTAQLVVIYDPKIHPVFGPITRTVSVFSNDPWKPKVEVSIYAEVQK